MDPLSITASLIAIIDSIDGTRNIIRKIEDRPKAFEEVEDSFPLAFYVLTRTQDRLHNALANEKDAILAILQPCFDKAEHLQRVFDDIRKHCEKDNNANEWPEVRAVYCEALRGREELRVEKLMMDILDDMRQLELTSEPASQIVIQGLEDAIVILSNVDASLPDSELATDRKIPTPQEVDSGALAQQDNVQEGSHLLSPDSHVAIGAERTDRVFDSKERFRFFHGDDRTPLHEAARSKSNAAHKTVSTLISNGANVNAADKNGWTPLHEAARSKSDTVYETISTLIGNGADVNAADNNGRTPLHEAAQSDLDRPVGVINMLLSKGAYVNAADNNGRTPLHEAALSHSDTAYETVSTLIIRGANVDAEDNNGQTPLYQAAQLDSDNAYNTIATLIHHHANINAADNNGRTPLHEAARSDSDCSTKVINVLLSGGAYVDAADNNGRTPLHEAAQMRSRKSHRDVAMLLAWGTDINAADNNGRTPLHEAAQSGLSNAYSVTLLIRNGADVNKADNNGRTPLHEAARSGLRDAFGAILKRVIGGANVMTAGEGSVDAPPVSSVTSIESVIHFLGFDATRPESAVVIAACSDKANDAILFLQLGVDPRLVTQEWRSRYGTTSDKEMPPYLRLWENAVNGHDYGTIQGLVREIAADHHVNFNSITWEWELPAIPPSDLENDVLLMCANPSERRAPGGHPGDVCALTYQEYLKQSKWADFVTEMLDTLARADLGSDCSGFSKYAMKTPPVSITCSQTHLSISFDDEQSCYAVLDLIEVLDWLCKSTRTPSNNDGNIISSSAYCLERYIVAEDPEDDPLGSSTIQLHSLRPYISPKTSLLPEIEHHCWLSLFRSCVIVDSPSPPRNKFGKGLELSFDLMIAVAAAQFCLKINGSLVFLGYQAVLYPVAIDKNCAQFHLITTDDGQINPYALDLKNSLATDNSSQFRDMRCFVGWCDVAQINLGTQQLALSVGYSGGRDKPKSLVSDGYSFLGQFGASSPLSAIAGLQKNFKYRSHVLTHTPIGHYEQLLQHASEQSVILYDATTRRCWLVPKLSLLLHMSQVYIACAEDSLRGSIPFAEPHTDAKDLIPSLKTAGETNVLQGQAASLPLKDFLLALSITMLSSTEALRKSDHRKIYGFEFMDIIHKPDQGTCMKMLKIESREADWLSLVNTVGTVVVCSNLGEVISATEGSARKCKRCNSVPESKDYLAATLPCLSRLARRSGVDLRAGGACIKLADKVLWTPKTNAFNKCPHEENSNATCWESTDLIQKVARTSSRHSPSVQPAQRFPPTGAVVFG